MGIPQGVTLIVGGGFHGKSTLLNSIQVGIYNHIPGDGREFVCTDPSAFAVRAEDGRCDNRPYSHSQYWSGTSLQWRLMREKLFKCN